MEDAESTEETAELESTTHLRTRRSAASHPAVQDAAAILRDDPDEHSISRALITRILFSGFQDKNTKIGKEALGIVEMYMRLFVKESIARTRQEAKNKDGASLENSSDDWLQVDDLEKVAPQLILDF
jgi:CENP-S associating Centromere protein X